MAEDGGLQGSPPAPGPPPKKRRCRSESKEEKLVRLKAKRKEVMLKEMRREANVLQRKLRKKAEKARLNPLGQQVLFFEHFLSCES